AISSWPRVP
ncbi:hypothetical protein STRIP9103_09719, partial [Streptomyces ipomoeae 91-03]